MLTGEQGAAGGSKWLKRVFTISGCLFVFAAMFLLNARAQPQPLSAASVAARASALSPAIVPSYAAWQQANDSLARFIKLAKLLSALVGCALFLIVLREIIARLRQGNDRRAIGEPTAYALLVILAIAYIPLTPFPGGDAWHDLISGSGAISAALIIRLVLQNLPLLIGLEAAAYTLQRGLNWHTVSQSAAYLLVGFMVRTLIVLRGSLLVLPRGGVFEMPGWMAILVQSIAIIMILRAIIDTLRQGRTWQTISQSLSYGFLGLLLIYLTIFFQPYLIGREIAISALKPSCEGCTSTISNPGPPTGSSYLPPATENPPLNFTVYVTVISALITSISGLYGQILSGRKMKLDYELALQQMQLNAGKIVPATGSPTEQPTSKDPPSKGSRTGAKSRRDQRSRAQTASSKRASSRTPPRK